ncbi:MAG: toxin-antitoxin system HicB family antitoxin [Rhizomicrobium sp.]|jgi:hypothetical protein
MSLNIQLTPEMEAALAAQAAAQGVPLPEYVRRLLEERTMPAMRKTLSPAKRAAYWRESVKGLPDTRPLSDEAIGRESIYVVRG